MCLCQDLTPIREQFPICGEKIYLNHASTGPMSVPGRSAIEECLNMYSRSAEFPIDEYFRRVLNCREQVARFINADPGEITFTHNTSEGIYIALINLPLASGDAILVMDEVFPAVRYVVDHNLPGIATTYIPFSGRDPIEAVVPYINERVKAVVVDYVQYLSGEMLNLREFGKYLRDHDIRLVVDGIQAIGAVGFDAQLEDVDFLACGAAKWLFGPSGTGFLYINKRNFDTLKGFHTGWLGAEWKGFEDCQLTPALYSDARMFEQGTRNILGISCLAANTRMLLDIGLKNVEDQIHRLNKALRGGLSSAGYKIVTPDRTPYSGILTVQPAKNAAEVYTQLNYHKVIVSLRSGYLRFSPHCYNTLEEIEQVLEIVKR